MSEPKTLTPVPLTPERLDELGWKTGLKHFEAKEVFEHIHAQEVRIDALTAEVAALRNLLRQVLKMDGATKSEWNKTYADIQSAVAREAPLSKEPT